MNVIVSESIKPKFRVHIQTHPFFIDPTGTIYIKTERPPEAVTALFSDVMAMVPVEGVKALQYSDEVSTEETGIFVTLRNGQDYFATEVKFQLIPR